MQNKHKLGLILFVVPISIPFLILGSEHRSFSLNYLLSPSLSHKSIFILNQGLAKSPNCPGEVQRHDCPASPSQKAEITGISHQIQLVGNIFTFM